jgi:hypothetical protein
MEVADRGASRWRGRRNARRGGAQCRRQTPDEPSRDERLEVDGARL